MYYVLIITPRLYVHVLPPPTYLGNTNNLQIHLYPLHNRYGWTVSDVDKKSQWHADDSDCSGYISSDLALVRLQWENKFKVSLVRQHDKVLKLF